MKPLLVLDLDETLVHCNNHAGDFKITVNGQSMFIKLRPHLFSFLNYMSQLFDLAVWSAGVYDYVHTVLSYFPKNKFKFVMTRRDCVLINYKNQTFLTKPLAKIKGYSKIYLLDDLWTNGILNVGKFIEIKPFKGERNDIELLKIHTVLKRLVLKNGRIFP